LVAILSGAYREQHHCHLYRPLTFSKESQTMKATIRLAGGNRMVEVDGENQKDLFESMAMAYEVFGETQCGLCGSTNIRPVVRIVDKFRFYEYSCQEPGCWAKLTFGQAQEGGGLFPKRKLLDNGKPDKDGEFGPHKGWTKYRGDNQEEPSRGVPQSSLPPESAYQSLRNKLGDIGAIENDMKDAVVRYVTRGKDQAPFGISECVASKANAEHALKRVEAAVTFYNGGPELLVKVQEWLAGGKK
jgi:hypothetical protein